jgi:2-keto-4-pentenoate hydratase/2-oxohepta-3-ene-1,7-dioic acid hydratase in catechol pathway
MRLITISGPGGHPVPAVLLPGEASAVDLSTEFPDMLALLDAGGAGTATARRLLAEARSVIDLADAALLAPVPRPRRLRDCSVFEEHMAGGARFAERMGITELASIPPFWYEHPIYYKGNPLSVVGPGAEIRWPAGGSRLDFELEIAAVIGTGGRDIPLSRAMDHIAGFVIYNDLSLRDLGFSELMGRLGPAKSKDFDTGNVLGPWLVTPDEIDSPYDLAMTATLNGELTGAGSTAGMYHRWDAIIAWASQDETLVPGEVIGAGTVGGGTLAELGRCLSPGDVISFAIDGLGTLTNQVGGRPRPEPESDAQGAQNW